MKQVFVTMMGLVLLTGCGKTTETTEQYAAEVSEKHIPNQDARTFTGRCPWNTRYGITVQMGANKIDGAKVIEYSGNDRIVDVPQTTNVTDNEISIVFDEHTAEAIGIANYKIGVAPVYRNGNVYVSVSGREVRIQEMPNKTN